MFLNKYLPIQAQNWTQQIACIRSGKCQVVLRILLIILAAPVFASASLTCISLGQCKNLVGTSVPCRNQNTFFHGQRCHRHRDEQCTCGYEAQLFELRVAKGGPEEIQEINCSEAVAEKMADRNHPTCFRTSIFARAVMERMLTYPRQTRVAVWVSARYRQLGFDRTIVLERDEYSHQAFASVTLACIDCKVHSIDTKNGQSNGARPLLCKTIRAALCMESTDRLTEPASVTNIPTISDVHPSTIKHIPTINDPPIMNGLLLPHFDLELSASTPTTGCMISPERGPAIHTKEVLLFVRPNWRRYGVQSVQEIS